MDAVAVTIAKSVCIRDFSIKDGLRMAFWFALFQAAMPLAGWLLGIQFESYIVAYDHWVAFGLLGLIGGKMFMEGFEVKPDDCNDSLSRKTILLLALATSIDALAVGVSFAFLAVNIVQCIAMIGLITFMLCFGAGRLGVNLGSYLESKANFAGGLILIGMGTKILLEHVML